MKRTLMKNRSSYITIVPPAIVEHFGLAVGDALDFKIDGKNIRIVPVPCRQASAQVGQHPAIVGEDSE